MIKPPAWCGIDLVQAPPFVSTLATPAALFPAYVAAQPPLMVLTRVSATALTLAAVISPPAVAIAGPSEPAAPPRTAAKTP